MSEFVPLGVPPSLLSPFLRPAKEEIKKQLGITVPDEAQVTFSAHDREEASLNMTWTLETEQGSTDYFSAAFENVNISKGTGKPVYVRSQGTAAERLVKTLASNAKKALEVTLNAPVSKDNRLVAELSAYAGERTAVLQWEPAQNSAADATRYFAGYEQILKDYSGGTLVTLETVQEGKPLAKGVYTEKQIEGMRQTARAFLTSQEIGAAEYVRYTVETPGEKGNAAFYFSRAEKDYPTVVVYVNAKEAVSGYALSPNPEVVKCGVGEAS